MLKSLSSEQEIEDINLMYHEHFDNPLNAIDDLPLIEREPLIKNPFGPLVNDADTGTEVEALLSDEVIADNLGFVNKIPLLFNAHRHMDGHNCWANPEAFEFNVKALPPWIKKIELHWHQLAGMHAIVRAIFTPEPLPKHCTGVLIADEVGLGKTYQAATVVASLADAAMRQDGMKISRLLGQ